VGARKRFGVHLERQQHFLRQCFTQRNRAAVSLDGPSFLGDVRGFEGNVQAVTTVHSRCREDVRQAYAAPLRG
jgi:hypothetical protein